MPQCSSHHFGSDGNCLPADSSSGSNFALIAALSASGDATSKHPPLRSQFLSASVASALAFLIEPSPRIARSTASYIQFSVGNCSALSEKEWKNCPVSAE